MDQAKIFVSYCHEDMDSDVFDMILADLNGDRRLQVISDRLARVGDDIAKFMDLIKQCHAVIVLCTPAYNRKVMAREQSVYTEYTAIVRTYATLNGEYQSDLEKGLSGDKDPLNDFAHKVRDPRFAVLPVLISGTAESAIPQEFRNKLAADLVGVIVTEWRSTGEARPQKQHRNTYDMFISSVGSIATGILEGRNRDADKHSRDVFRQIFFELKHDTHPLDRQTLNKIFVKTLEYMRVSSQQSYILVGRKGSGKSTIVDFLAYGQSNRWKTPVLYNVNDLPLELMFTVFYSGKHDSDLKYVLPRSEVMKFAWEAFLHYLCFHALSEEFRAKKLPKEQHARFEKIADNFSDLDSRAAFSDNLKVIESIGTVTMARHHAFFCYILAKAIEFVDTTISNAPTDGAAFAHYLTARLTPEHFVQFLFGAPFLGVFYEIVVHCHRNFLIALDGFDSQFQRFRSQTYQNYRGTELLAERNRFERDWLSGLIAAVRRSKNQEITGPLSGKLDFCVTIPKDRFIEYLDEDRDAYEWEAKQVDISWTGIELAILLRKRLEVYRRYNTSKEEQPMSRLYTTLAQQFPILPTDIPVQLGKRTVSVPIFQYVLRYTFWRPRDVLFLWGKLISAAEYYAEKGIPFDAECVKLVISQNLLSIIKYEFIKEFSGSVENIETIVRLFHGGPQVFTVDEFFQTLGRIRMAWAIEPDSDGTGAQQRGLQFLYNIGFVGFRVSSRSAVGRNFQSPWVFVFNEGDGIMGMLSPTTGKQLELVIHPLFVDYLELEPYAEAVVCDFPNDYLVKQEARRGRP